MTMIRRFIGISIAFLLTGCSTIQVQSDYDRNANLSELKAYQWVPGPQPLAKDPRIDNSIVDTRIRNAIDRTLASKGYQKQTGGVADFLVSYQAAIQGKLDVTTIDTPAMYSFPSGRNMASGDFYSGNWAHSGSQTFVTQYDEGTLIIDIVDPQTRKLLWRGTGKATVLDKATPEKREARIQEGVGKILEQFPPGK